jgi:hypothetical protein
MEVMRWFMNSWQGAFLLCDCGLLAFLAANRLTSLCLCPEYFLVVLLRANRIFEMWVAWVQHDKWLSVVESLQMSPYQYVP